MNEARILIALVLAVGVVVCSGCSTGGYIQIGYIPVSEVNDQHMNKPEHYIAKKK